MRMRTWVSFVLAAVMCAAGGAQAQTAPAAAGSGEPRTGVEELTNTLMRKGLISEEDWWRLIKIYSQEKRAPYPAAVDGKTSAPLGSPLILMKDMTLKINALGQFRYTYAKAAEGTANTSAFQIKAARLIFTGDLPKSFRYALLTEFARANGATTQVNSALLNYWLTYAPVTEFNVSCGQFSAPVSAEALTPTAQIDFANRYYAQERILNPVLNADVGVMASGKVFDQRLQYAVGVFNGKGANYVDNDNADMLYAGRLQWTALKGKLFGKDASLTFGGNGMWKRTLNDPSSLRSTDLAGTTFRYTYSRFVYGGDMMVKAGPAKVWGEYIAARLDGQVIDPDVRAYGYHVSAAYKLPGDKVELLGRYQVYDPDARVSNNKDMDWTTVGLNWFINGQYTRMLVNYTIKNEKLDRYRNDEVVTQLQLSF